MKDDASNKSFYEASLITKDLNVIYKDGVENLVAVNNVCLDIYKNEFTVIMGQSGCGKTSLLKSLGGLLKPDSGHIFWNKDDITKYSKAQLAKYRREYVGFVFQNYNLIPELSVEDNIIAASSLVDDSYSVKEVLQMVGLEGYEKSFPSKLSGGQKQRVCLARAITKKTKILLCDEPTGALDSKNASLVVELLKDLCKNQNICVVMITHNEEYKALADHGRGFFVGVIAK